MRRLKKGLRLVASLLKMASHQPMVQDEVDWDLSEVEIEEEEVPVEVEKKEAFGSVSIKDGKTPAASSFVSSRYSSEGGWVPIPPPNHRRRAATGGGESKSSSSEMSMISSSNTGEFSWGLGHY